MANLKANNVCGTDGRNAITGSVEFDGTGDYLTAPNSSDFRLGTSDFTIEGWATISKIDSNYSLFSLFENATARRSYQLEVRTNGAVRFEWWYDGSTGNTITTGTGLIPVNQWNHYAVVRNGSTLSLYINGISVGNSSVGTNSFYENTADPFVVGGLLQSASITQSWQGFISNFRVIKGTALYTQNFIPPTSKLTNLPGTVLLCCQDNESVATEVTGKTITANGDPTATRFTPSVGSDGSVEFAGPTTINTENYFYLPTGPTEQRGRGRGVFGGGYIAPANVNTIDFINIQSTGNAIDFGDTSTSAANGSALGSSTRGVIGAYNTPSTVNTIEYITFATTSNSLDFGDLTLSRWGAASASSRTRGIFYSGYVAPANVNNIDYITIASVGNAIDFGDAITSTRSGDGCSSSTRGLFAGGVSPSLNTIEYITIATTGNSQDFGDLTVSRFGAAATSSSTRAIFCGGYVGPAGQLTNTIDYVTMSSIGNAIDFGDLTRSNWTLKGLSNSIRGIIGGGYAAPSYNNNIDYVTIASTGNASDFGDMTSLRGGYSACSDSHGGLG